MNANIELSEEIWYESGNVFVRGHAFVDAEYKEAVEIAKLVSETNGIDALTSLLERFNGFYSIIVDDDDRTLIFSDRMRTGPVFYASTDDEFLITDDCGWLLQRTSNIHRSTLSEIEYERSRFVTGPNTLYKEISQLQSGEIVVLNKVEGEVERCQRHVHTTSDKKFDSEEIHRKFLSVLHRVFDRVIQVAQGRQIVVPLSGGYDSRLIALMLEQSGYENVITYSVKLGGLEEGEVAEEVAENLDLPWATAKVTHSDWRSFYNSKRWGKFFEKSGFLGSLPDPTHIITLERLIEKGKISQDAIVLPGHSALDTMKATPTKLEAKANVNIEELASLIIDQHYKYNTHIQISEEELTDRFSKTIGMKTPDSPKSSVEAFERWRLKERRTKLIVNGNRPFDFIGLDWWMPLEDDELYQFWRNVPIERKRHRTFYESYITELYTRIAGIDPEEAGEVANDTLKTRLADVIREYPIWPLVKNTYEHWEESRIRREFSMRFGVEERYWSDPRLGILTEEQFKEVYNGQNYRFHPLLAQLTTGNITFED
jgi:asparagine synthase (glutamine-hydrolysing)